MWHNDNLFSLWIDYILLATVVTTLLYHFIFGQEEWADARSDNRIEFINFSIIESDPFVDAGTVTFSGYEFTHAEESSSGAKGILYMDSGNMVYYAKKLGNTDWHNKVSTVIKGVEANAQYTLTVEVEPEKGLNMVTTIPNAKNAQANGDAWYKNWIAENTSNKLTYKIIAQSDTLEVNFQVGQDEYAKDRENNRIKFKSISLEKNEGGVDTDTVTFCGREFTHVEESSSGAKGSLYLNDDGNMVYYAEKLSSTDWHNKVTTVIEGVKANAEYTLMVEVELEKGLNMVTTIPKAKNAETNGDAWYKDWLAEKTSTKLTHKIIAQSDTLEVNFQFGQDEYADAREDNHIVFKSVSLNGVEGISAISLEDDDIVIDEKEPVNGKLLDESENLGAETEQNPEESEDNGGETEQQPEETEQKSEETEKESSESDSDKKEDDEEGSEESESSEETEHNQDGTGISTPVTSDVPKKDEEEPAM